MTQDEIFEATREILVESLGVSADEVKPTSYLIDELGAESIDFLDIFYLAESKLKIRITQDDFAAEIRRSRKSPAQEEGIEWDAGRMLTDEELLELAAHLPVSTHDRIKKGLRVRDIIRLVNVEALAEFFAEKVKQRTE